MNISENEALSFPEEEQSLPPTLDKVNKLGESLRKEQQVPTYLCGLYISLFDYIYLLVPTEEGCK